MLFTDYLRVFGESLVIFAILYVGVSIFGILHLLSRRDTWNPDFAKGMKSAFFVFELFIMYPIGLLKSLCKRNAE